MNALTRYGIVLGVGTVAGMALGWQLWKPSVIPAPKPQPEVVQEDGSHIAAVDTSHPAKPPHQIPHGATVEDVVRVTIQPNPVRPPSMLPASKSAIPVFPPVTVDLSIVRMRDGSRRVIASSSDGAILSAIQIPAEPVRKEPKALKWGAGIDYTVTPWGDVKSLVGQRTWGPLAVLAHAGVATANLPNGARVSGVSYGVSAIIRF